MLFELDTTDPVAYGVATAAFLLVGLGAALVPAHRATRVDTVEALSAE